MNTVLACTNIYVYVSMRICVHFHLARSCVMDVSYVDDGASRNSYLPIDFPLICNRITVILIDPYTPSYVRNT